MRDRQTTTPRDRRPPPSTPFRPRPRQHRRSVVAGQLPVGGVQLGLVAAGPVDRRFLVVRDHEFGHAAPVLDHPDVRHRPVRQRPAPGHVHEGVVRRAQDADEQRRLQRGVVQFLRQRPRQTGRRRPPRAVAHRAVRDAERPRDLPVAAPQLVLQGTFRRGWKRASLHQVLQHGQPARPGGNRNPVKSVDASGGSEGVQWHAPYYRREGAAWLGVNLAGSEYDGWATRATCRARARPPAAPSPVFGSGLQILGGSSCRRGECARSATSFRSRSRLSSPRRSRWTGPPTGTGRRCCDARRCLDPEWKYRGRRRKVTVTPAASAEGEGHSGTAPRVRSVPLNALGGGRPGATASVDIPGRGPLAAAR